MSKLIACLSLIFMSFFFANKKEPHVTAWHHVLKKCNAEIYKKYGLRCSREGGSFCNNIEELYIAYNCYTDAPLSLERARILMLSVYQDAYACCINDSHIQPYLNPNPLPTRRFHLHINFVYPNGKSVETPGEIFSVLCCYDKLNYCEYTQSLKPLFTETLEEARSRVQACANQNPEQP